MPEPRETLHDHFSLVIGTLASRIDELTAALDGGKIDVRTWSITLRNELEGAHTEAVVFGRKLAGDGRTISSADINSGKRAWREQQPFFRQFVLDVLQGKYSDGKGNYSTRKIAWRSKLYVKRLRGTVNEAWVQSFPEGTLFYWRTGANEKHCQLCPVHAAGSPYLAHELPTVPGACQTPCLVECCCYLETEGGEKSFRPQGRKEGDSDSLLETSEVNTPQAIPEPTVIQLAKARRVENAIKRLKRERVVAVTADGKTAVTINGSEERVAIPQSKLPLMRDTVITHNHGYGWAFPATSPQRAGKSFSLADIRLACKVQARELRAVTPVHRYTLRPPAEGWSEKYFEDVLEPAYRKIDLEIQEEFESAVEKGAMKQSTLEARWDHELVKRLSIRLGMAYNKKKL